MIVKRLTFDRLQWMTSVAMIVLCALIVATFLGLKDADRDREQAACDGALDTRRVVIDLIDFTGESPINPDDYTGELRMAIIRSQARAKKFRDDAIAQLEQLPPQCQLLEDWQ